MTSLVTSSLVCVVVFVLFVVAMAMETIPTPLTRLLNIRHPIILAGMYMDVDVDVGVWVLTCAC